MCLINSIRNNDIQETRRLISDESLENISLSEALIEALERGYLEIVKTLIEAGADINQETIDGTPLGQASLEGHLEIVEKLLEAGANPNLLLLNNQTPLILAAQEGYF